MNDHPQLDEIKAESSLKGKDPQTRLLLIFLVILWLITLAALVGVAWNAYFQQKNKTQTLAQQIALACEKGDFGDDFSHEDEQALCSNAEKVIQNDPELQDAEIQESEIQESEIQEAEIQEAEIQDPENQNGEKQDAESQEDEIQDPEIQDEEIQDPEIQDEEIQDPEHDDPDPNDQMESGSCTFDGSGTITMTFQTSSGPMTFQCEGTGSSNPPPDPGEGEIQ